MSLEIAQYIVLAGVAFGVLVWLIALWLFIKLRSTRRYLSRQWEIHDKTKDEAIKAGLKAAAARYRVPEKTDDGFVVELLMSRLNFRVDTKKWNAVVNLDIDLSRLSRLMTRIMGWLVLFLEPLVIGAVGYVLLILVAPSETPAVRWQVLQVLQIIHVLWPPFLVYYLFRRQRNAVIATADNFLILIETSD